MTTFVIEPYSGPSPLQFGMSREDVAHVCGSPIEVRLNNLDEWEERRDAIISRYSINDDRLTEVTFTPESCVTFNGHNLFNKDRRSALSYVAKYDEKPYECVGFVVFLKLGIAFAGFHDEDLLQQSITVFAAGRWDDMRGEMRRYKV